MSGNGERRPLKRTKSKPNGAALHRSRHDAPDPVQKPGPPPFTEWGSLVAVKVIQIAEIISRSASQVYEAGYGIRNSELRILLLLGAGEKLAVNEISRRAGIDKAWISRSLDVMMRADLVKRISHPSDSRKSLISLTDRGEQALRTITPIAIARDKQILAGLDSDEIHAALDALRTRAQQLLLQEPDRLLRHPALKTRAKAKHAGRMANRAPSNK